jgi:chromosome partitioning protein
MAKIIAITNQKGGVGKTTTSINLSTAFAAIGQRTLLIDLDPQGNASTGLGIDVNNRIKNIYNTLIGKTTIKEAIGNTIIPTLKIVPSVIDLAAAEIELNTLPEREKILKKSLQEIANDFDFIIIDCPPSLGLLTVNALIAAHSLLIPLQCEFFALEGLAHLVNTINLIKRSLNRELKMEGILLTMVDKRNKLSVSVENEVRETFKDLVYETTIPRNVKVSEAPSHGKPALIYDDKCIGSVSYMLLAKEILNKNNLINENHELLERKKRVG